MQTDMALCYFVCFLFVSLLSVLQARPYFFLVPFLRRSFRRTVRCSVSSSLLLFVTCRFCSPHRFSSLVLVHSARLKREQQK
jgi:hypothetical protein